MEGEEIVNEGEYLMDSESQLKSGDESEYRHGGTMASDSKPKVMRNEHKH